MAGRDSGRVRRAAAGNDVPNTWSEYICGALLRHTNNTVRRAWAAYHAAETGQAEIAWLSGEPISVHAATANGHAHLLSLSGKERCEPDTSLALAAMGGHIDVMKLLYRWGERDVEGAFNTAMAHGHWRAANLARKMGARNYLQYYLLWGDIDDVRHRKLVRWIERDGNAPLGDRDLERLKERRQRHQELEGHLRRGKDMLVLFP